MVPQRERRVAYRLKPRSGCLVSSLYWKCILFNDHRFIQGGKEMSAEATTLETEARPWWVLLIEGILAVVIGAILLWAPAKAKVETYQILVAVLGLYWVISGIMTLVHMFQDHTAWGWKLFMGVISIIAGAYVLMYPVASGLALPRIFVLVLGIWGIMQGIVMLVMAFRGGGWGIGILGALLLLLGIYLVANWSAPLMGLAFLWAAAITALVGGVFLIVIAFRQRSA
jgi:uncharacterized membrane protein HdeD (DUF308 family)